MFFKKKHRKIRIRVIEEDSSDPGYPVHVRSRSFYPGANADFNLVCLIMSKMGFRPSRKK